jgi:hypothetical protein
MSEARWILRQKGIDGHWPEQTTMFVHCLWLLGLKQLLYVRLLTEEGVREGVEKVTGRLGIVVDVVKLLKKQ